MYKIPMYIVKFVKVNRLCFKEVSIMCSGRRKREGKEQREEGKLPFCVLVPDQKEPI